MSLYQSVAERLSGQISKYKSGAQTDAAKEALLSSARRAVITGLLIEREAVINTLGLIAETERTHKDNIDRLRDEIRELTGAAFDHMQTTSEQVFINKKIVSACTLLRNRIEIFKSHTKKNVAEFIHDR